MHSPTVSVPSQEELDGQFAPALLFTVYQMSKEVFLQLEILITQT